MQTLIRCSRDLLFTIVSNGQYMVPPQASRFLVVSGAVVEGIMGSWATFFATANAYISDCSEPGSRYFTTLLS